MCAEGQYCTSRVTRLGFIQIIFSTSYDLKQLYPQSLYNLINIIILCESSVIASDSVFLKFYIFHLTWRRQDDVRCVLPARECLEIVGTSNILYDSTRLFIELYCSELVVLLVVCAVDTLMHGPARMVVPKFGSSMGMCEICKSTYADFSPQLSFIYIHYKVKYICILRVHIIVIYTVLYCCFGDFLGCSYIHKSDIPYNWHYQTTQSPY